MAAGTATITVTRDWVAVLWLLAPERSSAAFNAAGGAAYTYAKVPVENNGIPGSADSHWRESILDDELMTTHFHPLIQHNPLSAITIQAMADIGYRVDVTQAESYKGPFVTSFAASAPVVRAAEEDSVPLTCIVEGPTAMPDKPATIVLEVKGAGESE